MVPSSVHDLILEHGKWITSQDLISLIQEKREVGDRQAYKLLGKAYETKEIQKQVYIDGAVWYGIPELGPPTSQINLQVVVKKKGLLENFKDFLNAKVDVPHI